jgi:hypothetical protein
METGTIGAWDFRAKRKAPPLNSFTWPSGLRVPSGKTMIEVPPCKREAAFFELFKADWALSLLIRICPERCRLHPKMGIQARDFLAIKRTGKGKAEMIPGMSSRLA